MFSVKEIAKLINGSIFGDDSLDIAKLSPFFKAKKSDLTFASDEKILKKINETEAGVIIVPEGTEMIENRTYITVSENPRNLMPILLSYFKPKTIKIKKQIEDSSNISVKAEVSTLNTYVGHFVKIGEGTIVYPNVTILEGVVIGKNCIIYPNVTIREFTSIGDNVIIQPGAVIGSDGFGYVQVNGINIKIEQIGNVIIENDVEIGANTCIDRGTIGETIIKKGTKIDNLVHIAHNDIIGSNCFIAAQAGISGSVEIGDNTSLAGQVGVAGHLKIGSNVVIAAKSGVTNNVPDNSKMSGYPLREHMEDLRIKMSMSKIPNIIKRIKEIEERIKQ